MKAESFAALRESLGMTRTAFAAALGMTRLTQQRYEDGKQPIPLTVALACSALKAGLAPLE